MANTDKKIFLTTWDPRQYLTTYYQTVEPDEIVTIRWVVDILKSSVHDNPLTLIYGIGPAIKDAIPVAPYAREIDVTDFNPSNLREIKRWVSRNDSSFSWTPFIKYTLECEGIKPIGRAIRQREKIIRNKIKRFIESDADHILKELAYARGKSDYRAPYDLVISMYCIDSSTDDKAVWRQRMQNIAHLVAPGGLFITAALGNTSYYEVGDMTFPSANVSRQDLTDILALDFSPESIRVEERGIEGHGYNSILLAYARKPV